MERTTISTRRERSRCGQPIPGSQTGDVPRRGSRISIQIGETFIFKSPRVLSGMPMPVTLHSFARYLANSLSNAAGTAWVAGLRTDVQSSAQDLARLDLRLADAEVLSMMNCSVTARADRSIRECDRERDELVVRDLLAFEPERSATSSGRPTIKTTATSARSRGQPAPPVGPPRSRCQRQPHNHDPTTKANYDTPSQLLGPTSFRPSSSVH